MKNAGITWDESGLDKSRPRWAPARLAARLSQIGLKHHFVVAGDFNLVLLDQLLTNKVLEHVYFCNKSNCGYGAEGYACGAAAAVVTFSVGSPSASNPMARAHAENLPVILVSGAPQHQRSRDTASATPSARNSRFVLSVGDRQKAHLCCSRDHIRSQCTSSDRLRYPCLSRQKDTLVQHDDAVIEQHKKALAVLQNAMAYEEQALQGRAEAHVEETPPRSRRGPRGSRRTKP